MAKRSFFAPLRCAMACGARKDLSLRFMALFASLTHA